MSDNELTGTSLEVLSFMASGIKKRTGSEYSDGRPGRINYHSEDEYRTVTLTVQATAYDMQDVAHLRDSINELFDGELMLREMRIKSVEVEYESMGQRTGELQLENPEYVNGKQIKVAMVNSPEIDDTTLVSTFTVEFETTELPYFETIYTTLELHDSGYSATAEKYGLVDNINIEKLEYRFAMNAIFNTNLIPMKESAWEDGSLYLSNGENSPNTNYLRLKKSESIKITPGETYTINDSSTYVSRVIRIGVFQYKNGVYTGTKDQFFMDRQQRRTFTAVGDEIRISLAALDGYDIPTRFIEHEDERIKLKLEKGDRFTGFKTPEQSFNIYNAGNVKIEPESMMLNIIFNNLNGSKLTLKNKSTDEEFIFENSMPTGTQLRIEGMVVRQNLINRFRDTNKKFISLVPGENQIEISGITFDDVRFEFKYLYK